MASPTPQKNANNPLGSYPVFKYTNANGHIQGVSLVDSDGNELAVAGLVPTAYDYIELTYTGSNLTTVTYKTGGSGGTTVATLTLAYTGSQLDSVTKT